MFEEEDRLTELDLDDLFDAFDDYAERFAEDATAAEAEALTAVGVFDDSPDLGRLVVRAALAVASTRRRAVAGGGEGRDAAVRVLGLELAELKQPVKRREDEDERRTRRTPKSEAAPRPTAHEQRPGGARSVLPGLNAAQGCMRDSLSATRVGSGSR